MSKNSTPKVATEIPTGETDFAATASLEIENVGLGREYESSVKPMRPWMIGASLCLVVALDVVAFWVLIWGGEHIQKSGVGIALVSGPFLLTGTTIGLLLRGVLSRPQAATQSETNMSDALIALAQKISPTQ